MFSFCVNEKVLFLMLVASLNASVFVCLVSFV